MANHTKTEISVGVFVLAGLALLGFLSLSIGGLEVFVGDRYRVKARFASVGDLADNASVRIAGVKVGRVEHISLENYAAEVVLAIDSEIKLPGDTIASIRTEGLLGKSYVSLSPGASEKDLADGGRIPQTESAIDLIDILSKYAFESEAKEENANGEPRSPMKDPLE